MDSGLRRTARRAVGRLEVARNRARIARQDRRHSGRNSGSRHLARDRRERACLGIPARNQTTARRSHHQANGKALDDGGDLAAQYNGKELAAWTGSMIVRGDTPIVAWSQAGATDNRHLYVSDWVEGDRWIPRLSGLHLVEGVSNVNDVKLAAGDGRTLFVSWDEPGQDKRGPRVVQAYPCAAGETPDSAPASRVERDTWPTTVDEAARQIASAIDTESRDRIRATKKDQLIQYHHGWGMGIRNSLGLWRGNDKLLQSCGNGTRVHPDSCSMMIIEAVWALLQSQK